MFAWPSPCCRDSAPNAIEIVETQGIISQASQEDPSQASPSWSKGTARASKLLQGTLLASEDDTTQEEDTRSGMRAASSMSASNSQPESMGVVRHLSRMLTGQIGLDVEKVYELEDPDVAIVSANFGPVQSLPKEVLDSAITQTIAATEALLPQQKMSDWQQSWCIRKNVQLYLDSVNGNVQKAAEHLALALIWREKNKDILSGARVPKWVMDGRVLCKDRTGHPLVYGCFVHQSRFPSAKDNNEHLGVVMNKCLEMMPEDVTTFDWLLDLYGFRISSNMDPRATIAMFELVKHPFRDRLRQCFVIDAPKAFSVVWNVAYPHVPAKTRDKIAFIKSTEVVEKLAATAGPDVADKVRDVMAINRSSKPSIGSGPPAEKID